MARLGDSRWPAAISIHPQASCILTRPRCSMLTICYHLCGVLSSSCCVRRARICSPRSPASPQPSRRSTMPAHHPSTWCTADHTSNWTQPETYVRSWCTGVLCHTCLIPGHTTTPSSHQRCPHRHPSTHTHTCLVRWLSSRSRTISTQCVPPLLLYCTTDLVGVLGTSV